MDYYLIYPTAISGTSYFKKGTNTSSVWEGGKNKLVLKFTYASKVKLDFFCNVGFYFISDKIKRRLKADQLNLPFFRCVDNFYEMDNNGIFHENKTENHWLVLTNKNQMTFSICNKEKELDLFVCRHSLFVSQKCLNILTSEHFFEDDILGKAYGKEYEILTNRFQVEGDIEDFIINKMPKHREHIAQMQKKIMAEYRRREGLPPLP